MLLDPGDDGSTRNLKSRLARLDRDPRNYDSVGGTPDEIALDVMFRFQGEAKGHSPFLCRNRYTDRV